MMNLTISNVVGPRERGHIAGGVVNEIYSVGPVVTGRGMNITVWSYVDQLAISVLTDDRTLEDPHEATDACWPRSPRSARHCRSHADRGGSWPNRTFTDLHPSVTL